MIKFTVILFLASLACSSALTHIGPVKKQAVYNNGAPTSYSAPAASYAQNPANLQAALQAQQLASRPVALPTPTAAQQVDVAAQQSQSYLAAAPQTSAAQQTPFLTTQSGQPLLSLSQFAAKQQLPSYYPQQYFPQQALYPASTSGQNLLYNSARLPQGPEQGGATFPGGFPSDNFLGGSYPGGGFPAGAGSQIPQFPNIPQLPSSQYPIQQFPGGQYPQYPQFPQYPQYPAQLPGQYPAGGFPSNQFPQQYPTVPGNGGVGSSDAVVTTSPGAESSGADVVIGSRIKPDKPDAVDASQESQKTDALSASQQYVALPQSQYAGQLSAVQDPVQLNSAAKGAVSSYLLGQTQPQYSQAQIYQQPQASAQQYVAQLALPAQYRQQPQLLAQSSYTQQIPSQYSQQIASQALAADKASYAYPSYAKQRSDDYSQSSNEVGSTPSYVQSQSQGLDNTGSTTPSYSKPSGVSLFAGLERDLKQKRCKDDVEIRAAIGKWFHEQPKEFYETFRKRIQSIEQRAQ